MFLWKTKRLYLNVICFIRMVAFQLQLNADPFNHFGKFLLLACKRTQFLSAASPSHATESIMRNKSSRKYFG